MENKIKKTKVKITTIVSVCLILTAIVMSSIIIMRIVHKDGNDEEDGNAYYTEASANQAPAEVDTMTLHRQTFTKQILCNGKLVAMRRAELVCPRAGEILQSVNVSNGQHVAQGTLLAVADTRDRKAEVERAQNDLERARVELQDKLISLGYSANAASIPADVLHRAEVTSGYNSARFALRAAQKALADCRLTAPFGGRVADLTARAHQRGDKFCTLIDDTFFDVEFQVLESELAAIKRGTSVSVSPFIADTLTFHGTVTEINPTISSKGLVTVKARIRNTSNILMDGMNVKVIIENNVPQMLVVPKEAVVERDGYHVVFMYDCKTRRAVWTYVDIVYSNLTSHAITGCARKDTQIHEGDIVITSGNLNLADDTEVKVN